jgi:hypothetical protein
MFNIYLNIFKTTYSRVISQYHQLKNTALSHLLYTREEPSYALFLDTHEQAQDHNESKMATSLCSAAARAPSCPPPLIMVLISWTRTCGVKLAGDLARADCPQLPILGQTARAPSPCSRERRAATGPQGCR